MPPQSSSAAVRYQKLVWCLCFDRSETSDDVQEPSSPVCWKCSKRKALHKPQWICKSCSANSCPWNSNGKDASSVTCEGKQTAQLLQAPGAREESGSKEITCSVFRVNLSWMEPLPRVANCEIGSQEGSQCVGSAALSSRLKPILVQRGWGSAVSFLLSFQNSPTSYSLGQRERMSLTLLQIFCVLI